LGLPEPLFKLIFSKDSNVYVDWDLNFVKYVMETVNKPVFLWEKVGCSLHFLDRTPDRLPAFLHTMQQTSAQAFFKIVTKATQPEDSQKIWNLFHKRNGDSRPLIAFAMGEIGMESRFKCLSFGSAGTYGYIDGRQSAAPGQVPFHQLMADLRIRDYLR
jgi:3-dehydroquinate dehydratase type I